MVTLSRPLLDATHPSCREAALAYAEQGLPVFPVCGKVPYARTRGFHEATCDPERIAWWWRRWPQANVAIPTGGVSGWVALDIDGRHAGFTSLRHLQAQLDQHQWGTGEQGRGSPLTATRVARTGSGLHLLFQPPVSVLRNRVQVAGYAGIDLRAEGGYIVVAPSLHPTGRRYCWERLLPSAPFPLALLDLLEQRQRQRSQETHPHQGDQRYTHAGSTPDVWLHKALQRARVGTRHACALWLACRLVQQAQLSYQHAEPYMCRYVEQVPGGGTDYPLSDALACLAWATTHVMPHV